MIPAGMPDTTTLLPPEFFINPRCPSSASFDLPSTAAIREEPPAKSPLAADDGIDIPLEPLTKGDEESNVVAEG